MNYQNHKLCPLLWKHLCVNTDGSMTPCCEISNKVFPSLDPDKSLQDEYNSDIYKSIRKDMLDGISNPICEKVCYSVEQQGYESKRIKEIKKYEKKYGTAFTGKEKIIADINQIDYLDIKPSNFCNSKCVMCNNNRSSQFAVESKKYRNFDGPAMVGGWYKLNKQKIESIYHQLWRYKLNGGETTVMPEFESILEGLSEVNNNEVNLVLNINNTVDITKYHKYLSKINQITIVQSIEGWGLSNSYIRYPSDWNTVYNNLKSIYEYKNSNKNIVTQFGILVLSLNFVTFPFLIENLYNEFSEINYFIYHINQPKPLLVNGLTKKELEQGLLNLEIVMARMPKTINDQLQDTLKFYQDSVKNGTDFNTRKKMLEYINHIDKIRKIKINDYLKIDLSN